jgi:hypothetical protein
MSQGIENHVDWIVPSTPEDARPARNAPRRPAPARRTAEPRGDRRSVMDTLLGKNDLAAFEISGSDPYNATGRHVRR